MQRFIVVLSNYKSTILKDSNQLMSWGLHQVVPTRNSTANFFSPGTGTCKSPLPVCFIFLLFPPKTGCNITDVIRADVSRLSCPRFSWPATKWGFVRNQNAVKCDFRQTIYYGQLFKGKTRKMRVSVITYRFVPFESSMGKEKVFLFYF